MNLWYEFRSGKFSGQALDNDKTGTYATLSHDKPEITKVHPAFF
ncbi:hypothetical protein N824_01135 [Pedobacter sp. V48]|nr:hypothetical protein N824_01135 [Pedobacter sp. V48]